METVSLELLRSLKEPLVLFAGGVDPLARDLADGYQQRVAAIDSRLRARNRVYVKVNDQPGASDSLRALGSDCYELQISPGYSKYTETLFRRAHGIYCHSIYTLQSVLVRQLVSLRGALLFLDLHGAVPEENEMLGGASSVGFHVLEAWAVLEANVLVHVSHRMRAHIDQKYPWVDAQHIVCPIFPSSKRYIREVAAINNAIVYAGGAQPWQHVSRIAEYAASAIKFYDFQILTPKPDAFLNEFAKHGVKPDGQRLRIASVNPDQVWEIYRTCRFGLLYREGSVIDRVSCPTKLVEYLHSGLLPVLESSEIGDFRQMEMTFATIREMVSNELPQGNELADRISQNFRVADAMAALSSDGLNTIARLLEGSKLHPVRPALNPRLRGRHGSENRQKSSS